LNALYFLGERAFQAADRCPFSLKARAAAAFVSGPAGPHDPTDAILPMSARFLRACVTFFA
jgi:hypothetical protein